MKRSSPSLNSISEILGRRCIRAVTVLSGNTWYCFLNELDGAGRWTGHGISLEAAVLRAFDALEKDGAQASGRN